MSALYRLRKQWLVHRPWAIAVVCAALFLMIEPMIANWAHQRLTRTIDETRSQRETLGKQIAVWREDGALTQAFGEALSEKEVALLLAPFNSSLTTQKVESAAASSRLFNVVVSFSPPTPWPGEGLFAGIEGIDQRVLTLDADAPLDTDVLTFLDHLDRIDGKLDLESLTLSRLPASVTVDAPVPALNIHAHATFRWLVNRMGDTHEQ